MATHVIPYNPWREQLALTALGNIAGDIIGDMWKTHRQNEQNRKVNAFRGELQNLAQQQQGNISLAQPQAPQGYNSNPWASALHQSYSPLTQFDIGTAGIGKTPSLQDIARNADTLAASKRFSMLSPETVKDVRNSMMQNAVASLFGNASDIEGRMNALTMGAANGVVPPQVLTAFSPWARDVYSPFTFHESDLGQNKNIPALNKHTGQANTVLSMPVTVSPNETARNAASMYSADRSANAHIFGSNSAAETARQRLEHDRYTQMMTDYDNQLKGINDEITAHLAVMDTLPNDEARAAYRLSVIAPLEQDKARITAERNEAQERYRNILGFGAGAGTAQNSANSNNVWFGMVGNPKGISIHPHGTFGYDRGDHKHGGIDIRGVTEGTDIKLMPEMGDNFIVKQAYKSNSYGNNIVIESDRKFNGKTVEFRIAHMQDGSLNLKPGQTIKAGDIVGKVGSTGRSTRAHIHLEVMVDGQKVDPQTFFQNYTAQAQNTPNVTAVGNLQPQQLNTPQTTQQVKGSNSTTQNSQQTRQKSPVTAWVNEFDTSAYISTSDGNSYSKDEIEKLAQSQGLTLPQWLEKNNVQPFPALFPNTTAPRDPVAYMSNRYGNYFTQDEIQREAARKNLALEDYENQLREQGYRKADEDFPIENTQNEQDQAVSDWGLTQGSYTMPDSKRLPNTNPILDFLPKNDRNYPHLPFQNWPIGTAYNPQPSAFPDNYGDKNRRNSAPNINSDNQRSSYSPAWNFADFVHWINRYSNNENTFRPPAGLSTRSHQYHIPGKSVDGNPFSNLMPYLPVTNSPNVTALNSPPSSGNSSQIIPDFPIGADVIPQSVLFSDPFYFLKLKYGNNWR